MPKRQARELVGDERKINVLISPTMRNQIDLCLDLKIYASLSELVRTGIAKCLKEARETYPKEFERYE